MKTSAFVSSPSRSAIIRHFRVLVIVSVAAGLFVKNASSQVNPGTSQPTTAAPLTLTMLWPAPAKSILNILLH